MTIINDPDLTWSAPLTLASDEVWQTRAGRVFVTTTSGPDANDGIELFENHAIRLSAGLQVRYRKEGATAALIVREAV